MKEDLPIVNVGTPGHVDHGKKHGVSASDSNELLCGDWVDANKSKPPEGAFVLVDGDYFKTMVVAAWVPRDDNKFPWKISTGSEMDKWAEDAVKCWCYLPKPCDT